MQSSRVFLPSSSLTLATASRAGVVACLLESALPFTVLGIVYVITYARKSPYSFAFLQVWADFCVRWLPHVSPCPALTRFRRSRPSSSS